MRSFDASEAGMRVSLLVVLAALAAVVPSAAGGFAVADQLSAYGWLVIDTRTVHLVIAGAASFFSALVSGVGAAQLDRVFQVAITGRHPVHRPVRAPSPAFGAVLCLFSSLVLFLGTVLPDQTISGVTFTLVNVNDPSSLWPGVIGWWIPIVLLALVSAGTLIWTATKWRFVSGGMLLAFGVGLLTAFISPFIYTPTSAGPGGVIGTVGGALATLGGLLAVLRAKPK